MRTVGAFIGTFILCMAIGWSGGYNFDTRNIDVATGVVVSLTLSVFASIMTKIK